MNKKEFQEFTKNKLIYLDGATGSNLQAHGMPTGVCPEKWILENEDVLINLQREFVKAGSNIVYAPTFTANRIKLKEYGLENDIARINEELLALSKKAVENKAFVAADMTMTGRQLEPVGDMPFEELVDVYKEQATILSKAGADLFVVETMMSIKEARAALIAIKEVCDLPVMVTLSFREEGRTFYGTSPEAAVVTLQSLGADAIGANCSTGPDSMVDIISRMKKYASVPIIAKPNAGLPRLEEGKTVYTMEKEDFADWSLKLVKAGASIIGGCCGTRPDHIEEVVKRTKDIKLPSFKTCENGVLSSETDIVEIDKDARFIVVGERINPTGKKAFQESLRKKDTSIAVKMAEEQAENGAKILDINVGMAGINEKEMMVKVIEDVGLGVSLPLCIDSSYPDVVEAALRVYPGRALINSISLESVKVKELMPIAKKYGAMFILLPVSDEGMPKSLEEKRKIIDEVLDIAKKEGFDKKDIIVDALVGTVGANINSAKESIELIRYCKEEAGLATICGLSNISFGLPGRPLVNSAYAAMVINAGLTMAIANPSNEMLMDAVYAADMLAAKDGADFAYIERVENAPEKEIIIKEKSPEKVKEKDSESSVFTAVLKGNKTGIVKEIIKASETKSPEEIINEDMIPAIKKVGDLFEMQKYFLPQLMSSAEAMKIGVDYLEPKLSKKNSGAASKTVVIATVEGDVHDIGKNLVALMMKNYGFKVIDLGKDVPKEVIVERAIEEKADVIALSALMTTTMVRMEELIKYVREKNLDIKVIIGGAVVTQEYADEIGADGYSKDAAAAAKLVDGLKYNKKND